MRWRVLGLLSCLAAVGCPSPSGSSSSSSSTGGTTATSAVVTASSAATSAMGTSSSAAPTDGGVPEDGGPLRADAGPEPAPGTRESLRWRTAHAFEHHLMQALALTEDEVCKELGLFKCITRPVNERPFRPSGPAGTPTVGMAIPHQVALGGNEPFDLQNYEPRRTPGATTPNAVDRVVLAACDARVEKDRTATPPVVFTGIDLSAGTLSDGPELRAVAATLFRRFHLRDGTTAEMDLVTSLAQGVPGDTPNAADVALAVCVAIGGMAESSFD